ncbi:MAG TPA: RNase J family beta-CASP ribonuclease [Nanoarchaeota archaeon]|nr:RNase J family beta-CASP ribonuclease [Nanoarchaeota archaeon]HIH34531.1 RNase J family beta-CASP ribonuclease [Nanoarchaeota archaeon]HIH66337.1 RNase J family beta-CASP ribonuclease [Nanoarchaeota archaeon]
MKFYAVGGFSEVGKNMVAMEMKNGKTFIVDEGLYLPPIVELEEGKHVPARLREIGALPNDSILSKIKSRIKAQIIGHAHLDHVGAVPYLEKSYKADIYGTPFTMEVLNALARDNDIKLQNKKRVIMPNSSLNVEGTEVEFLHVTHSTLQTAIVAVHDEEGPMVYANDFKFDNTPVIGKKPDYAKLKKLASKGVHTLVVDALYAGAEQKTPSEKIARDMLGDVLLNTNNEDACIVVTTFSSHIARLKSIVDFGKQMDRKILFLGRSLYKYVNAAVRCNLIDFHRDIEMHSYRKDVKKAMKQVNEKRSKYLLVCTGHQGEPGSVLVRMANDQLPFKLKPQDHVIFSSKTIPAPINIANKNALDKKLRENNIRIFSDVHVSGHASKEDLRDIITMLKPKHIIPAHGDMPKLSTLAQLCVEMGYDIGKNVHLVQDGQSLELK